MMTFLLRCIVSALIFSPILLGGCAPSLPGFGGLTDSSESSPPSGHAGDDADLQKVLALRKKAKESFLSLGSGSELRLAEEAAATRYLMAGTAALNRGRFDEAIRNFDTGLIAQPSNAALAEARVTALKRKEVVKLTASGERARTTGNRELAQSFYQKAALLDRSNAKLQNTLKSMDEEQDLDAQKYVVKAFNSKAALDMNFRTTKFKDALKVIADPHNINFIFDPDVENAEVNVSAKQVTFAQAFNLLLSSADCFHKVIGENSVLVAPNTNEKKEKYHELYFKTFHLTAIKAPMS